MDQGKEEVHVRVQWKNFKCNTSVLQGTVRLIPTQVLGTVSLCRPKGNLNSRLYATCVHQGLVLAACLIALHPF